MMLRTWLVLGLLSVSCLAQAAEPSTRPTTRRAPPPPAYLDEAWAGSDFQKQGEYEGVGDGSRLGAQIIAMGRGEFRGVFLAGGLPGAGWDGAQRREVNSTAVNGRIRFDWTEGRWFELEEGKLVLKGGQGAPAELKKVLRQSPTLGAKPPQGAIVLFDGTNTDAWVRGRMDSRNLLMVGTQTRQRFGDCTLHVEFILPFMPDARGQGRGNSGVYLQNRYEVQVLDSFGLRGADNECGGIYQNARPLVNMCFPPLSWQTFDIDFTAARFEDGRKIANARITVRHNGVVIHDNLEIRGATGGGQPEADTPGPLMLQDHGNPVFYRNIWIVPR